MTLKKVNINQLRSFIEASYKGDKEFLDKYYVAKCTLKQAVNQEIEMIRITSQGVYNMVYFGVIDGDKKIGHLCYFVNNLYSFGIAIEKRTKEILSEFWEKIVQVLGESFIAMLFPNNTRAINWLKRCGMVEVDGVEENCVTLLKV